MLKDLGIKSRVLVLILLPSTVLAVALFTGVLYVSLLWLGVGNSIASLATLCAGFLFRVLAMTFQWKLPHFQVRDIRGLD